MAGLAARKNVHFNVDESLALDLPSLDGDASGSFASPGNMQFINAQLLAHGFAQGAGISTDGLSGRDAESLAKCLVGMLGQRTEDMKRAEELSAKFRTLSYEYENQASRHKETSERALNAEREMNLHKSKLAAANRTLQTTTLSQKHTAAELGRTRSAVQALRATHLSELRKRDKDLERMAEKCSKVSDAQLKMSSFSAGLTITGARCANALAADGQGELLGSARNYLEVALEEADRSRALLAEENDTLRRLLLRAVNEGQDVMHELRIAADPEYKFEPPTAITTAELFPLAPNDIASEKLGTLFSAFKACVAIFADPNREPTTKRPSTPVDDKHARIDDKQARVDAAELERLRMAAKAAQTELAQAQKHSVQQAEQLQALMDQLASREAGNYAALPEPSIELLSAPAHDDARAELDALARQLEGEREHFTEATVQLGNDRVALERERIAFLEERRAWQVTQMLGELPPTPVPAAPEVEPDADVEDEPEVVPPPPRRRAAKGHRSPAKAHAAVLSPARGLSPIKGLSVSKKARGRRSSLLGGSLLGGLGGLVLSPRKGGPSVLVPSFETEVAVPPPAAFPSAGPPAPRDAPAGAALPPRPSAFVLPPPSPMAKLLPRSLSPTEPPAPAPPLPAMAMPASKGLPPNKISFPPISSVLPPALPPAVLAAAPTNTRGSNVPPAVPAPSAPAGSSVPAVPETPRSRFAGGGKFGARNLQHAYSPAKPSPLSRILLLANSPPSPDGVARLPSLGALLEADEDSSGSGSASDGSPTPAPPGLASATLPVRSAPKPLSLAAELGLSDDDADEDDDADRDGPLQAKPDNARAGRPEPRFTAEEKGKSRAGPVRLPARVPAPSRKVGTEKENAGKKARPAAAPAPGKPAPKAAPGVALRAGSTRGAVAAAKLPGPKRVVADRAGAPARKPFS